MTLVDKHRSDINFLIVERVKDDFVENRRCSGENIDNTAFSFSCDLVHGMHNPLKIISKLKV